MKTILIFIIELYRRFISPLKSPCCKYYPSCSLYAISALKKYGIFKGIFLAVWRVLRCNPFSRGGYDPLN